MCAGYCFSSSDPRPPARLAVCASAVFAGGRKIYLGNREATVDFAGD